jgi:hypothetical protein
VTQIDIYSLSENQLPKAKLKFISFPFCPVNPNTHQCHYKDLPDGYQWCSPTHFGLINLLLSNDENLEHAKDIPLGRSQSRMKMFVSVVQLTASCITLYRSSGSQLDRYGYAAFGLTVFPYTLMSFVNFVCLAVVGDYPCVYILPTGISREAEIRMGYGENGNEGRLNAHFDELLKIQEAKGGYSTGEESSIEQVVAKSQVPGTPDEGEKAESGSNGDKFQVVTLQIVEENGIVLRLRQNDTTKDFTLIDSACKDDDAYVLKVHPILDREPKSMGDIVRAGQRIWIDVLSTHWGLFAVVATFLGLALPYLVIYALTRFRQQQSTVAQRAWIISWLVTNQLVGLSLFVLSTNHPSLSFTLHRPLTPGIITYAAYTVFLFFLWLSLPMIPAIGGFVTVGKMLFEFGTCSIPGP